MLMAIICTLPFLHMCVVDILPSLEAKYGARIGAAKQAGTCACACICTCVSAYVCAQAADQMLKDGKAPADIHGKELYDQAVKGRFVGAQAWHRPAPVLFCVWAHSLDHAQRDVRARVSAK